LLKGAWKAESDLDVLLIVKNDGGRLKRKLRRIGYLLARPRMLCHLSSRTLRKSGKAGEPAPQPSVRRWNVTRCASYEVA
jgi:hypothetical protein